jgi:hypothetical protein
MRAAALLIAVLLLAQAQAGDTPAAPEAPGPAGGANHRFLIERSFPAGALDGLDAATKAKVNANNAKVGVRWIESFATADKTRTFCVYEGPSEDAVHTAASLNGLPVDKVTEVPVTLTPQ